MGNLIRQKRHLQSAESKIILIVKAFYIIIIPQPHCFLINLTFSIILVLICLPYSALIYLKQNSIETVFIFGGIFGIFGIINNIKYFSSFSKLFKNEPEKEIVNDLTTLAKAIKKKDIDNTILTQKRGLPFKGIIKCDIVTMVNIQNFLAVRNTIWISRINQCKFEIKGEISSKTSYIIKLKFDDLVFDNVIISKDCYEKLSVTK